MTKYRITEKDGVFKIKWREFWWPFWTTFEDMGSLSILDSDFTSLEEAKEQLAESLKPEIKPRVVWEG